VGANISDNEDVASLTGRCACGTVRFQVTGEPRRVGLCHCTTCRKAHASAFHPFAAYLEKDVVIAGRLECWESSPGYLKAFCPLCGSHVAALKGEEIELSLGSFDGVGLMSSAHEGWVKRAAFLASFLRGGNGDGLAFVRHQHET
jgi:hypothetical protein